MAQGKPAKFIYRVVGNYRATQLQHTASNGDMVDLYHTNNIHTAGFRAALDRRCHPGMLSVTRYDDVASLPVAISCG